MKVWIIFLFSLILTACSNEISINENMKYCEVNLDCTLIQPDCSDCKYESVNKKNLDTFLENKKQYCNKNKPRIMCDSIFNGEIKCIENKCQLK